MSRALLLCLTVGILAGCGDGGCNRANSDDGERNHLGAFNRPTLPTPQQCAYGTAGCPCLPGWKCGEGLRCFGDYCYGGKVPAPDTYFYKDRQFADMHAMRELVLARSAPLPAPPPLSCHLGAGRWRRGVSSTPPPPSPLPVPATPRPGPSCPGPLII